jgi:uncharacterized protein with GYD domain
MPKYLFRATYTADGIKGLEKDKATGRAAAVRSAVEALGGKMEAFYLAFGEDDVVLLADLPDNVSATAFTLTISKSGLVRTTTTPLISVEEADRALEKKISYRAPGQAGA